MQEISVCTQITNIVVERGNELLRTGSIPKFLWVEAMTHTVWLKNRSPTKSHKYKKTPFELMKGMKPNLAIKRIWGSRTFVTKPQDKRLKDSDNKITSPRGWLGYFMGFDAEPRARIWNEKEKKVYAVSEPNINDSEGLDDSHKGQALNARLPPPDISSDPEDWIIPTDKDTETDENFTDGECKSNSNDDPDLGNQDVVVVATQSMKNSGPRKSYNEDTKSENEDSLDNEDISKYDQESKDDADTQTDQGSLLHQEQREDPKMLTTERTRRPYQYDIQKSDSDTEEDGLSANDFGESKRQTRVVKKQQDASTQSNKTRHPNFKHGHLKGNIPGRVLDSSKCKRYFIDENTCDGERPCGRCKLKLVGKSC